MIGIRFLERFHCQNAWILGRLHVDFTIVVPISPNHSVSHITIKNRFSSLLIVCLLL